VPSRFQKPFNPWCGAELADAWYWVVSVKIVMQYIMAANLAVCLVKMSYSFILTGVVGNVCRSNAVDRYIRF
jgi:hypothetical protein